MFLKQLFTRKATTIDAAHLPHTPGFADVKVGSRPIASVCVERAEGNEIATREVLGVPGEPAVFVYVTAAGRFRFETTLTEQRADESIFAMPATIARTGDATAAQKRSSVRLDTLVAGQFRLAPGGVGIGDFVKCSVRDISRGGCSLITERPLAQGTLVEVRLLLRPGAPPPQLVADVVRSQAIPSSGRHSHGLRFHGVRPQEDQAIRDYINRKQAELRSRGLA